MVIANRAKPKKRQNGRPSKYDISFRRKIAKDYEQGERTMRQIALEHGVSKYNVKDWVKKFSCELAAKEPIEAVMTEEEQKELRALKEQVEALKKQLEYEQMKSFAFETMIDLANEELGIDIRKNSGAKQPGE